VNSTRSATSACWHLFVLTLRRQFFSRQTLASLALATLCVFIVLAWSRQSGPTSKKLAEQVLVPTFVSFLMPIFAICYGASGIGGEREDRTLIYLLISSIPRPVVYLMKGLAGLSLVAAWTAGTLFLMCRLAGEPGTMLMTVFLPASLLGGLAYASLFLLVGALFRHGTIISLVYWFFLEVLFGNLPGIVKRVSVAFYVRCMVYEAGGDLNLGPAHRAAREMFLPVTGTTATLTLIAGILTLLMAGLIAFEKREYRDAS
jgi:ABC-2 type transport system permease protein